MDSGSSEELVADLMKHNLLPLPSPIRKRYEQQNNIIARSILSLLVLSVVGFILWYNI